MNSEIQPGDEVNVPKELEKWGISEPMPEGEEPEPAVVEEVFKGLGSDEQADVVKLSHPEWNDTYFLPKDEVDKSSTDS
ncbi:MAG: hypothetical protein JO235_05300 [Chroococcidiopsidaceae cyanobacterium CP_BM_RX_35]|nr:hypothetical protein [Chroococcidiopsidaceae cyanobacterium CP_BM_RX_35]